MIPDRSTYLEILIANRNTIASAVYDATCDGTYYAADAATWTAVGASMESIAIANALEEVTSTIEVIS